MHHSWLVPCEEKEYGFALGKVVQVGVVPNIFTLETLTRVSLPGTERAWRLGISVGCVSSLLP
jgi:hypothetical protein